MKTCTKCGEVKPLDEFHRNKASRDGRVTRCKSCVKAYQAEWRERPEVQAHKTEYDAEYRRQNRGAILAHMAEHYAENRDALRAQQAEYRQANRHVRWETGYRVRAREYGFEPVVEPFTKAELVARWGDACWHCGGPFEELDHAVVPVALGGHHTLENCRPSCAPCNAKGCGVRRTNTNEAEN